MAYKGICKKERDPIAKRDQALSRGIMPPVTDSGIEAGRQSVNAHKEAVDGTGQYIRSSNWKKGMMPEPQKMAPQRYRALQWEAR